MKQILSICIIVLALALAFSFLPVYGEENVYDSLIRLHVLANSDSEADQADKLAVRDAILSHASEALSGCRNIYEAGERISSLLSDIEHIAADTLAARGSDKPVHAEFGEETYPKREYEGFDLPAGKYTSLRVVIGEGNGHNWWCVLFPPLCTKAAEKQDFIDAGISAEGYRMITDSGKTKYRVRFRILEIISDIFGMDY